MSPVVRVIPDHSDVSGLDLKLRISCPEHRGDSDHLWNTNHDDDDDDDFSSYR